MKSSARQNTCRLLEMVDEGLLDPVEALTAALLWHSDDDVGGLAEANGFWDDEVEDEEGA